MQIPYLEEETQDAVYYPDEDDPGPGSGSSVMLPRQDSNSSTDVSSLSSESNDSLTQNGLLSQSRNSKKKIAKNTTKIIRGVVKDGEFLSGSSVMLPRQDSNSSTDVSSLNSKSNDSFIQRLGKLILCEIKVGA